MFHLQIYAKPTTLKNLPPHQQKLETHEAIIYVAVVLNKLNSLKITQIMIF